MIRKKWSLKKIETGSIDSTQIITDQQEEKWLKYLGYTGLAFSIMLLPLGFTSIFWNDIISVINCVDGGLYYCAAVVREQY